MKSHLRLKILCFVLATLAFFVLGVALVIKGKMIFGAIAWMGAMIMLINVINYSWDLKKLKRRDK